MRTSTRTINPLPLSASKFLTSMAIHDIIGARIITITVDDSIDKTKEVRLWSSENETVQTFWFGVFTI